MEMNKTVLAAIEENKMLNEGDKVIVALSGGADSTALLFFLKGIAKQKKIEVFAVHINHMLRKEESDRDMEFVRKICSDNLIELFLVKKDVNAISCEMKISVEEAGRIVRRKAYEDALLHFAANKIATGHNKNDQAETLLFRLARGTGTSGLSAIRPVSGKIIRPFINVKREEIENYCETYNIQYITDSTNHIPIYSRNKIRLSMIPWIEENLNPKAVDRLAQTAELISEQNDFIASIATEAYKKCKIKTDETEIRLDIQKLKALNTAVSRQVLLVAIKKAAGKEKDISFVHVNDAFGLLFKGTGKQINLPYGIVCSTSYNELILCGEKEHDRTFSYKLFPETKVFVKERNISVLLSSKEQQGTDNLNLICTKEIKCDRIFSDLYFRTRKNSDFIRLRGGKKKLKAFFIDKKIPRENRDCFCLLADGNEVLSIIDLIDSETIKKGETSIYLQIWEDSDGNC